MYVRARVCVWVRLTFTTPYRNCFTKKIYVSCICANTIEGRIFCWRNASDKSSFIVSPLFASFASTKNVRRERDASILRHTYTGSKQWNHWT